MRELYRLVETCIWLCLLELGFYGALAVKLAFEEHRLGMNLAWAGCAGAGGNRGAVRGLGAALMSRTLELAPMRLAARSAAVRPHSAFLPSPRPVSSASPCSAALFFVPAPRPFDEQLDCAAGRCSQGRWEHGGAREHVGEQEKRAFSCVYATVPTVPTGARVRVMRARACICSLVSLSLGTWKHSQIGKQFQRLALFPRLFPAPAAVGTWEQIDAAACRSQASSTWANKVGRGYAALRRSTAGAGAKFGSSPTRRAQIGGFPPFSAASDPQVGRLMLEGGAYAAEITPLSAARRKLGRLHHGRLTLRSAARHPGPPNRRARARRPQPMDALAISFELRSGLIHDRSVAAGIKNRRQSSSGRPGPGVASFRNARKFAGRSASCEAGKRAGVNYSAAVAQPHEAGEGRTLGGFARTVKEERCNACG